MKLDLILENIKNKYTLGLLQESDNLDEKVVLEGKILINESIQNIRKMLIEENTINDVKNLLLEDLDHQGLINLSLAGGIGAGMLANRHRKQEIKNIDDNLINNQQERSELLDTLGRKKLLGDKVHSSSYIDTYNRGEGVVLGTNDYGNSIVMRQGDPEGGINYNISDQNFQNDKVNQFGADVGTNDYLSAGSIEELKPNLDKSTQKEIGNKGFNRMGEVADKSMAVHNITY